MEPTKKNYTPAIIGLIAVVLLTAAAAAYSNSQNSETSNTQTTVAQDSGTTAGSTADTQTQTTPSTTSDTANAASSGSYKDGTYSADADYSTPENTENISVTLTIANGVVSDASVKSSGRDRESREYQAMFAEGYKSQVVGKSVDDIRLSRVAGSSLTSNGFNDALEQIRQKAEA